MRIRVVMALLGAGIACGTPDSIDPASPADTEPTIEDTGAGTGAQRDAEPDRTVSCIEEPDPCVLVAGRSYLSASLLPGGCAYSEDGGCFVELERWWLDLDSDGTYEWFYTDVVAGGQYECSGGNLATAEVPSIGGHYDAENDTLMWDGQLYVPAP